MTMTTSLLTVAYIGAAILFILCLGGLSSQETSRRGNRYGMIGMAIAVLATFAAAWHAYAYDWVVLAFPVFVLLPRARLSRSLAAALGILYVALWTFVWLAKASAVQPAMPALAFVSFVLVRKSPARSLAK